MPRSLHVPLSVVTVVAAAAVVAMAVRYYGADTPAPLDRWVSAALGEPLYAPSAARTVALVIDLAGAPVIAAGAVAVLAALCALLGRARLAVLAILGSGVAVAATQLLKPLVGRTISGGQLAFPSGHTAMLTAVGLVVALLVVGLTGVGRAAGTLLVVAGGLVAGAAMAWSLTAQTVHYATDTLGGLCTAFALVPATAWLIDRCADRVAAGRTSHVGNNHGYRREGQ